MSVYELFVWIAAAVVAKSEKKKTISAVTVAGVLLAEAMADDIAAFKSTVALEVGI